MNTKTTHQFNRRTILANRAALAVTIGIIAAIAGSFALWVLLSLAHIYSPSVAVVFEFIVMTGAVVIAWASWPED